MDLNMDSNNLKNCSFYIKMAMFMDIIIFYIQYYFIIYSYYFDFDRNLRNLWVFNFTFINAINFSINYMYI